MPPLRPPVLVDLVFAPRFGDAERVAGRVMGAAVAGAPVAGAPVAGAPGGGAAVAGAPGGGAAVAGAPVAALHGAPTELARCLG